MHQRLDRDTERYGAVERSGRRHQTMEGGERRDVDHPIRTCATAGRRP